MRLELPSAQAESRIRRPGLERLIGAWISLLL
jgi:hypothetical protein